MKTDLTIYDRLIPIVLMIIINYESFLNFIYANLNKFFSIIKRPCRMVLLPIWLLCLWACCIKKPKLLNF